MAGGRSGGHDHGLRGGQGAARRLGAAIDGAAGLAVGHRGKAALLSEARAAQRTLLPDLDTSVPEVSMALDRQRRVRDKAAADIERQVRRLEVVADRIAEADAAARKGRAAQEAARQLAA